MSVLGKKPFINKILDSCDKDQIATLADLMNNLGEPTVVSLYGTENLISDDNKGVSYVTFKLNELLAQTIDGILIYVDNDNCGFFGIPSGSDIVAEFLIDPVNKTYKSIKEYLTVEELRQICGDRTADIDTSPAHIRGVQTTLSIFKTFNWNINGVSLPDGFTVKAKIGIYSNFFVYVSLYDGTHGNDEPFTKQQAIDWMELMTGSTYLPEYNANKPQYTYLVLGGEITAPIYLEADNEEITGESREEIMIDYLYIGSMWKPQWSDEDGFRLYFVRSPYLHKGGLVFTNKVADNWVADNTYPDYGYSCTLTCVGITYNSVVEIIFGVNEALSGNYAPVCYADLNMVVIYSKVNDTITIPTIKEIV